MRSLRGMSLVDVIIGIGLILIIFVALTTLLLTSLKISVLAKTHSVAIAVAESQMEYVRSLSYANIGTVAGIPAGTIPQYATTTLNGLTFSTRTFIDYIDDPADGLGAADTNGITTDYKRAKITTTYYVSSIPHTVTLISNFSPPGIETNNGGGTLKIQVVNATGIGVTGATVHIVNTDASTTVDVTTFSDSTGTVFLPGALVSSQYQVYVSKAGYSSSQTYARDSTNVNPTPAYLTVAAGLTTTGTFAIDVLSTLVVRTFSPIATTTYVDNFVSSAGLSATASTQVVSGALVLSGGPSSYAPSGTASSIAITPTYLAGWSSASIASTLYNGTAIRFHLRDASGVLLPDTALAGNSGGFTSPTSLTGVSIATYPTLKLSVDVTTSDASTTPKLTSWALTYLQGPIPLPGIAYSVAGNKSIGTNSSSSPIVKTTIATSTDSTGVSTSLLEWDSYTLTLNGYDMVSACVAPPYIIAPATALNSSLILSTSTGTSLLIIASDGTAALPGASITISRPSFTRTVTTDACGNAYFGSLTGANDYTITGTKSAYTTYSSIGVTVTGHLLKNITLDPS
jgi:hypothetical protein